MKDFNDNQLYYESIFPGMTEDQASYILSKPYGSFPLDVTSKAFAIASCLQEKFNKQVKQELRNDYKLK